MAQEAVIKWKGIVFNVEFEYQAYEPMSLEHSGMNEEITEITELKHRGECFLAFAEGNEEEIKELIYKNEL